MGPPWYGETQKLRGMRKGSLSTGICTFCGKVTMTYFCGVTTGGPSEDEGTGTSINIIRVPLCVGWITVSHYKTEAALLNYKKVTEVSPDRIFPPLSKYFTCRLTLWHRKKSFSFRRQRFITDFSSLLLWCWCKRNFSSVICRVFISRLAYSCSFLNSWSEGDTNCSVHTRDCSAV